MEETEADENWADDFLDEEMKPILLTRNNGAYLTVDITGHIEYFYNTLECDNRTENPFKHPSKYQSLLYPVKCKESPNK